MNILLTFDNNYTQHAGVVIASFLSNNEGIHAIYIISDYISEDNQKKLSSITIPRGCSIDYHFIDSQKLKSFPIGKGMANDYVSIATYFRLFMTEVLPPSIDKILYIDTDTVIDGQIDGLWNCSFDKGKCIIALEESERLSHEGCKRLKYPSTFSYFNAGILLINLKTLREVYDLSTAINFIQNNDIKFHDQDVMNGLLYDKKQFMELKYNVMDSFLIKGSKLPIRYEHQRDSLYNPTIIHFSGPIKPWHKESKNPYTSKYYKYLQLTPWRDYIPVRKYSTIKSRVIFFTKQIIKYLLDTLHIKSYRFIAISLFLLVLFQAHIIKAAKVEMPIIAFYGVPDTSNSGEDYRLLKECGFTVNQRYYPTISSLKQACRIANEYGVKILGRCPEMFDNPEITANQLKEEPGFFGYMLQDEPSVPEIEERQKDILKIKKSDDSHLFYINLLPYYRPEWVEPRLRVKTHPEYIQKLASTDCQQLSFDFYPITTDGIRPMWYYNLEMIRKESINSKKPFWAFVLSVPHNVPNTPNTYYPQPTIYSLRLQVYSNLAYGAQAIQYFTYWTPPREAEGLNYHDGPISADGKKTKTYDLVRQMNQELKTVARLFYGAKVVSVNHLGSIPEGTTRQTSMPVNLRSLKIVGRQGAVISQIEKEGHRYLAIVNKSHEKELTVRIRAKNSVPRHLTKSLQEESMKSNYTITAGDILLFKLK